MGLFLIIYFLLYGGLHLYVFLKAWQAFRFQYVLGSVICAVFVFMVVSPVIVRFLERGGQDALARLVSYAGYSWLGLMFFFFTISLSFDILRFFTYMAGIVFKTDFGSFIFAYRFFFFCALACSMLLFAYGYMEAGNIELEKLHIQTDNIPKERGKITIVQISDVHLGLIVREKQLAKIATIIKEVRPDVLVSPGDHVDGDIDKINGLIDMLKDIEPPYGKYAVMGNHEFYAGINNSLEFHKKCGFTVLRGEGLTIQGMLNIAGVDDPAGEYFQVKQVPEKTILSYLPCGLYSVLLILRAVIDKEVMHLFHLQLSGHPHKGQIFPFRYVTKLVFPLYTGHHEFSGNRHLYVSRGSGTWGPPIRFLTPPEVTVIEVSPTGGSN
jgi:predicted MPP superfamily phosphohydrolase